MSYLRKVEIQRGKNRRIEERRKAASLPGIYASEPPAPEPGLRPASPVPLEESDSRSKLSSDARALRRLEKLRGRGYRVDRQIENVKAKIAESAGEKLEVQP